MNFVGVLIAPSVALLTSSLVLVFGHTNKCCMECVRALQPRWVKLASLNPHFASAAAY